MPVHQPSGSRTWFTFCGHGAVVLIMFKDDHAAYGGAALSLGQGLRDTNILSLVRER